MLHNANRAPLKLASHQAPSLKALHIFRQMCHSPEVLQGESMHQAHKVGQVLNKPGGCLACLGVSLQILGQVASIHVHGLHSGINNRLNSMSQALVVSKKGCRFGCAAN